MGSTEWVEVRAAHSISPESPCSVEFCILLLLVLFLLQDKGKLLGANGLAYLNVDLSVEGTCMLHGLSIYCIYPSTN